MNRRGFASAALAVFGGFFLQRKATGETESETFKIGDAVRVDIPPTYHRTKSGGFTSPPWSKTGYVCFINVKKIEINQGFGLSSFGSSDNIYGPWYVGDDTSAIVKITKIPVSEIR